MIISSDFLQKLDSFNEKELSWLSGYCWAKSQSANSLVTNHNSETPAIGNLATIKPRKVLILSASQTGNAKRVAEALHQQLNASKIEASIQSIGDYKNRNIVDEDIVLLVSSTQGDGEYPEEAISFSKFLFGKKAPNLENLSFAVLALGDSSYPDFCQAGKNFENRFIELGATALLPRVDCDLDFQDTAQSWQEQIQQKLEQLLEESKNSANISPNTAINQANDSGAPQLYSKENPYPATLLSRQKITSRDANKDVQHIEIDLGDSGIEYQTGDSLGIYVYNDDIFVQKWLDTLKLDGSEKVILSNKTEMTLQDALRTELELTQNNNAFVKAWATLSQSSTLLSLVDDAQELANWVQSTPLLAVIQQFPTSISAQALIGILRPLVPRLYSIASAQAEVDNEVHLTVSVVRFDYQDEIHLGVGSGLLGERLQEDDAIKVFIEPNNRFRLPEDSNNPIIMIGAGTGIAPFRAFMQQRENDNAIGSNWLIFGNQNFTDDFLYQSEWQQWHKNGLLNKTSLAWSRKNPQQKVYVQHKIAEEAQTIWQWIQDGAHIYVCGDANNMAKAVEEALLSVLIKQGNMDMETADEYLDELRDNHRYQRDVY